MMWLLQLERERKAERLCVELVADVDGLASSIPYETNRERWSLPETRPGSQVGFDGIFMRRYGKARRACSSPAGMNDERSSSMILAISVTGGSAAWMP